MAAQLQQLAVEKVGAEGLNTEISAFQQALDFALKADNCVIDRVGRLASREAFSDHVSENDIPLNDGEAWDIVRMVTLEVDYDPAPTPFGLVRDPRSQYNVGKYTEAEYNGISNVDSDPNTTLCIVGIGQIASGGLQATKYGSARYTIDQYKGKTTEFVAFDRYIGAVMQYGRLVAVPAIAPRHGVTEAQLVPFMDEIYIFSKDDPVQVYDRDAVYYLHEHPDYVPPQDDNGIIADEINGDIACAAYGRLWVSGVNGNYDTIYYSDLLRPHRWYDGKATPDDNFNTAGIIDVREYWPNGNDRIKGIAAHNGFLIVFGRQSILIYSGVQGDPASENGLKLEDAIRDVGLVNQDAMCNIGTDHLFVDSLGVRSLGRVIQEKSSPIGEPSLNVATVIREKIAEARDIIRLMHLPSKSKAICLFPTTRDAYCFQLGQPSVTGGLRVTRWTDCDFWDSCTYRSDYKDRELLGGRDSRGVLIYNGYTQPNKYTMSYESTVLMSGQSLMQSMIPKTMIYSYHSNQEGLFARWGFGSNELEYMQNAKLTTGKTEFKTTKVNTAGSGEMLRVGFDVHIQGDEFAMQQISVNALVGRVIV